MSTTSSQHPNLVPKNNNQRVIQTKQNAHHHHHGGAIRRPFQLLSTTTNNGTNNHYTNHHGMQINNNSQQIHRTDPYPGSSRGSRYGGASRVQKKKKMAFIGSHSDVQSFCGLSKGGLSSNISFVGGGLLGVKNNNTSYNSQVSSACSRNPPFNKSGSNMSNVRQPQQNITKRSLLIPFSVKDLPMLLPHIAGDNRSNIERRRSVTGYYIVMEQLPAGPTTISNEIHRTGEPKMLTNMEEMFKFTDTFDLNKKKSSLQQIFRECCVAICEGLKCAMVIEQEQECNGARLLRLGLQMVLLGEEIPQLWKICEEVQDGNQGPAIDEIDLSSANDDVVKISMSQGGMENEDAADERLIADMVGKIFLGIRRIKENIKYLHKATGKQCYTPYLQRRIIEALLFFRAVVANNVSHWDGGDSSSNCSMRTTNKKSLLSFLKNMSLKTVLGPKTPADEQALIAHVEYQSYEQLLKETNNNALGDTNPKKNRLCAAQSLSTCATLEDTMDQCCSPSANINSSKSVDSPLKDNKTGKLVTPVKHMNIIDRRRYSHFATQGNNYQAMATTMEVELFLRLLEYDNEFRESRNFSWALNEKGKYNLEKFRRKCVIACFNFCTEHRYSDRILHYALRLFNLLLYALVGSAGKNGNFDLYGMTPIILGSKDKKCGSSESTMTPIHNQRLIVSAMISAVRLAIDMDLNFDSRLLKVYMVMRGEIDSERDRLRNSNSTINKGSDKGYSYKKHKPCVWSSSTWLDSIVPNGSVMKSDWSMEEDIRLFNFWYHLTTSMLKSTSMPPSAYDFIDRLLSIAEWPQTHTPTLRELAIVILAKLAVAPIPPPLSGVSQGSCVYYKARGIVALDMACGAICLAAQLANTIYSCGYQIWPERLQVLTNKSLSAIQEITEDILLPILINDDERTSTQIGKRYGQWGNYKWSELLQAS